MHVRQEISSGTWDVDYKWRTSQELTYILKDIDMYYFLMYENAILHKIFQLKEYIFKLYMNGGKGYLAWLPKHMKDPKVQIVAQLDQLYAYMLMLSLPESY